MVLHQRFRLVSKIIKMALSVNLRRKTTVNPTRFSKFSKPFSHELKCSKFWNKLKKWLYSLQIIWKGFLLYYIHEKLGRIYRFPDNSYKWLSCLEFFETTKLKYLRRNIVQWRIKFKKYFMKFSRRNISNGIINSS